MNQDGVFREGMVICLQNAESWLEEANHLYKQGSYGHCCALLIHGAEALAQAYTCWEIFNGLIERTSEVIIETFKNHRPKIDTLFGILVGNYLLKKISEATSNFPIEIELNKENFKEEIQKFIENSMSFYRGLMDLRNIGIYVNYDQDNIKFTSPLDLKKEIADYLGLLVFIIYQSILSIINANVAQVEEFKLQMQKLKIKFK